MIVYGKPHPLNDHIDASRRVVQYNYCWLKIWESRLGYLRQLAHPYLSNISPIKWYIPNVRKKFVRDTLGAIADALGPLSDVASNPFAIVVNGDGEVGAGVYITLDLIMRINVAAR
ncbi:hypothetical protein FRC12_010529 [Ceratobasidium sp. 428]|nr:hypothetical protein FRC12_010529 [Ceratobasidium sp. 428]